MNSVLKIFTRNLLSKLVAVVAAFIIWMNVSNEPDLATVVTVPVQYNNFPKGLEISSAIVDSINVEARGPSGELRSLHDSGIAAIIDFASVRGPGQRTFTITGNNLKLPRGIQLIRTIPAQLRFTFEYHDTKEVPIAVPFSGKLPPDSYVASFDTMPPDLEVGGPASQVAGLAKLTADPFDLTNVISDTEQVLSVYSPVPEVRILGPAQVTVRIHVAQRKH